MNTYESMWYMKFDVVYFLRDANGKVLGDDWRWQVMLRLGRSVASSGSPLPVEMVSRRQNGEEYLIARWDDLGGSAPEEWIASSFHV